MEKSDSYINTKSLYSFKDESKNNSNSYSDNISNRNKNNIDGNNSILNQNINNQNKDDNNFIKEEADSLYDNSLNNNINIKANEPPLFQAIYMQNINKIKELLVKGENPNCSLINGITPLHLAVNKKNEKIIEYLLKYNANPNLKTIKDGQTPVHYAVINNSNKNILNLLIKYGGLFNIKDNKNKTAFEYINNKKIYNYIKRVLKVKECQNNYKNPINPIQSKNKNNFYSLISELSDKNSEKDIIINNNTIYTDSSMKEENNNKNIYFFKNTKKDLLDSLEINSGITYEMENTENSNKENTYQNNKKENTSTSNKSKKINNNNNKITRNSHKKFIKRTKKTRAYSSLTELIRINKEKYHSLKENSDLNLTNIMKINTLPKIIVDHLNTTNSNLTVHRKSKSISNNNNNNNIFKRFSIQNYNKKIIDIKENTNKNKRIKNYSDNIKYKGKIFDNDDIKKMIEKREKKEKKTSVDDNIKNNKRKSLKKSIPTSNKNKKANNKNNYIQKDLLFSNISKINQKEDSNTFKLSTKNEINDEYFNLYSNPSSFRLSNKENININISNNSQYNNQKINKYNNKTSFYNSKYPIYYWLKEINLLLYYDLFIKYGVYSFDKLINKLKNGSFALTKEDFKKIGINKPGHIYRIIIKLEIDSGSIKKEIYDSLFLNKKINNSIFTNSTDILLNESVYYCVGCCEQNNNYNSFCNKKYNIDNSKLENWLNKIGQIKYINNFINNGFDILSFFILQMFSSVPIDENIIKKDLGIEKDEDIDIILLQLNKEVKYILSKSKNNNNKKSNSQKKILIEKNNIFYNEIKDNHSLLQCVII